ncbi:MAG: YfiR family protein, partial [Alphaproteobacteria bacterium]
TENLHICLLGGDPFNGILGLLSGHTAQKRVISIEERKNPYFVDGCSLAFINRTEEKNLDDILKALDAKPVLTVSDIKGFSRRGGMVELAQDDNQQIFLDLNVKAIEAANLRVKEDFLRMAGIIWLK